ncbi:MAG: aldose epimerase family protein [Bacteroidota bacterium]|nr:aldose epimerase family protein [Bacteroidota bacterium]
MTNTAGKYCFTHRTGEDIFLFSLRNSAGTEITITNYGAIISSFKIQMDDGTNNDIVLGFDNIEDYLADDYLNKYPFFGAAIGRYANRIKNAAFEIDGKKYPLTSNSRNNQLHGGHEGFDKKVWQWVAQGETPHHWLELKYTSPDGEEGYPGKLAVTIRFELTNDNELSYAYTASCDKATAVNLTHHGYFNLNRGSGTIEDHEVKIYASSVLEQDEGLVATGQLTPVKNTGYDFTEFTAVGNGSIPAEDFDKSFVLDPRKDCLVAEARSLRSGLRLQVYSTEPVVHFYTGKWIPVIKGKNGNTYGPLSGLCLETQKHPNAVNIPGFANTVLRSGETYSHKTTYKIII